MVQPKAIVTAIIEKDVDGIKYVYLQTRWKPNVDSANSGTLELPAGAIEPYEEVHDAIKREVEEECGLVITDFINDYTTPVYAASPGNSSIAFQPFICQQSIENSGGLPWIGYVFRCHAEGRFIMDKNEAKDPQWVSLVELKEIIDSNPTRIFSLHIATLRHYLAYIEGTLS